MALGGLAGLAAALLGGAPQGYMEAQKQRQQQQQNQQLMQMRADALRREQEMDQGKGLGFEAAKGFDLSGLANVGGGYSAGGGGGGGGYSPSGGAYSPAPSGSGMSSGLPRPSGGGRISFEEARQLAVNAGYTGSGIDTAAAIGMAESSGNPYAHNTKGEDSYGLMQLNAAAHGDKVRTFDPQQNMNLSYEISRGGKDFSPWSVYKDGSYRKYLQSGRGQPPPSGEMADSSYGGGASAQPPASAGGGGGVAAPPNSGGATVPAAGQVSETGITLPGDGARPQGQATAPLPKPAALPPPVRQEVQQTTRTATQSIDPFVFGKMSVSALAKKIDEANPGASSFVKAMALEEAQKLLAPTEQRMWDLLKQRHSDEFQRTTAELARTDRRAETQQSQQFQIDQAERTRQHTDETSGTIENVIGPDGKPLAPMSIRGTQARPIEGLPPGSTIRPPGYREGGTAGANRAADIAREVSRRDAEWLDSNPDATKAQIDAQHFKHSQEAERGMADAKAAPSRNLPAAIARKYLEAHPEATAEDLSRLNATVARDRAIEAGFGAGEPGRQVRSMNTLTEHISLVREYADALKNNDIPRINAIVNRWAIETGHPEVNDFNAARVIAADEFVRLLTSTGGTESDRRQMEALLNPNASPEQVAGGLNVFSRLANSRLSALRQQYSRGDATRAASFENEQLTPETRKFLHQRLPTATEPQGPIVRPEGGATGGPQPGDNVGGYIFKGGDPNKQENWTQAPQGAAQ